MRPFYRKDISDPIFAMASFTSSTHFHVAIDVKLFEMVPKKIGGLIKISEGLM